MNSHSQPAIDESHKRERERRKMVVSMKTQEPEEKGQGFKEELKQIKNQILFCFTL